MFNVNHRGIIGVAGGENKPSVDETVSKELRLEDHQYDIFENFYYSVSIILVKYFCCKFDRALFSNLKEYHFFQIYHISLFFKLRRKMYKILKLYGAITFNHETSSKFLILYILWFENNLNTHVELNNLHSRISILV